MACGPSTCGARHGPQSAGDCSIAGKIAAAPKRCGRLRNFWKLQLSNGGLDWKGETYPAAIALSDLISPFFEHPFLIGIFVRLVVPLDTVIAVPRITRMRSDKFTGIHVLDEIVPILQL